MKKCLFSISTLVYFLGFVSIWGILHIKLKIVDYIPMSNMTEDSAKNLNTVMENLSYSYLAGLIMFFLTVTIPDYKRKMAYKSVINNVIESYYGGILVLFYMFYVAKKDIVDIEDDESIKYYKEGSDKNAWTSLERIANVPDPVLINNRFREIAIITDNFFKEIIPYEGFLSNEQLIIVNKMKIHRRWWNIIDYSMSLEGIPENEKLFYKELSKHIVYVTDLKKSIN